MQLLKLCSNKLHIFRFILFAAKKISSLSLADILKTDSSIILKTYKNLRAF